MKYWEKHLFRRIYLVLYTDRRFDPYVFTFNLETETVSKLITFQ